ncbi:hypothetical protein KIL84_003736 [Mauremys mutica]|uniref:Uncharacterized protein n=1 Tax=Mauremys mutica TaxID=74926 RepID=A0A9D4ARI3_9SAUR|nr:hypothetical protein KIL84_003736 [Mauremys mutica]
MRAYPALSRVAGCTRPIRCCKRPTSPAPGGRQQCTKVHGWLYSQWVMVDSGCLQKTPPSLQEGRCSLGSNDPPKLLFTWGLSLLPRRELQAGLGLYSPAGL